MGMNSALMLYRLQKIDTQIDQVKNRMAEIDRLLNEDAALRGARQALSDAEQQQDQARQALKQAEQQVESQQIKIEDSETSLYGGRIHNPKELQDLQNDVASLKKYLLALENQQLEAMVALEQADGGVQEKQTALKIVEGQHATQHAAHLGSKSSYQKELERLDAERKAITPSISPDDIRLYDKLRSQKRGIAVVAVSESACEACGATLTPAEWQNARTSNKLNYCPTCGRILYAG